jgi:hypothetical protein
VGCYGARAHFIGPEDGRGGGVVRGTAGGGGAPSRPSIRWLREGEWGVRGEGKCGAVSERGGVVGAAEARGEGGGGGARSGFRRKKTVGLTDKVGPPVSEGEATGRLGWKGREEVGRGWARKKGRRPGRNHCSG